MHILYLKKIDLKINVYLHNIMEAYLENLTPEEKQVLEIVKVTFQLTTEEELYAYLKTTVGFQKHSSCENPPVITPMGLD